MTLRGLKSRDQSRTSSFRTASRPQLPAFTAGPVAEADESSATITWQTNVPANTIVDIGLDTGYGLRVEKRELSQGHEAVFNNLEPGTQYHFKVTSIDLSGNVLTTDPNGFELHSRDLTLRTLAGAPRIERGFMSRAARCSRRLAM